MDELVDLVDDVEAEPCGEGMCLCHCGGGHVCGCDCWRCDECGQSEESCMCDEEDADEGDDEEWQPGECDACFGSTPEDLRRAAEGLGIVPVCACAIGQGAPEGECQCGPEEAV